MTQTTIAKPSFGTLHAINKFYSAKDPGTPYLRDGQYDRVLCFANLSGAYNGNAGHAQALLDFRTIATRCNLVAQIAQMELDEDSPHAADDAIDTLRSLIEQAKGSA